MLWVDDVKDEMGEEARWNVGSDEDRGSHGIEDRMSEKLSWIIGRQQDRQEGALGAGLQGVQVNLGIRGSLKRV